jgi:translocation and assembly module TamA
MLRKNIRRSRGVAKRVGVASILVFFEMASAAQALPQQNPIQESRDAASMQTGALTPENNAVLTRFQLAQTKTTWSDLLRQHVVVLSEKADLQIATPSLLRKIQRDITSILETEAYFSPKIEFERSGKLADTIVIQVDAGVRTLIKEVSINFTGALVDAANAGDATAIARKEELSRQWGLQKGAPFRQDDWSTAKTLLMENLKAQLYAGAILADSRATVDPETNSAILELDVDSGLAFTIGEVVVSGLERYPSWLIDRFNPPKKGEAFSSARLLDFQRALQNSAYFSTVAFNVEPDSTKAEALPIEVSLTERQTRDLSFSAGYSSNTGFRAEALYRDRNILNQVWDLRSALRLEQKLQLSYVDIYLPPSDKNKLDSFGVLLERRDAQGLVQLGSAFGVNRTTTNGRLEQKIGAKITQETVEQTNDAMTVLQRKSKALVGIVGWTWRAVDDLFDPREGHRLQADFSVASRALVSDQNFFRAYGKYQYWLPFGKQDHIQMRVELGKVFSNSNTGIPELYLFRTGGASSVRGYAYQSLGVAAGNAVLGGQVMGVASTEYVHWTDPVIGVAAFVDMGDAAKNWRELRFKQAAGLGLRIKTGAGPLAVDLAYGRQTKKIRVDFSIAIAF